MLCTFLMLTSFLQATQNDWKIQVKTLSAKEVSLSFKYRALNLNNYGHHQTMIQISEFPDAESYILRVERPLVSEKVEDQEYLKKALMNSGPLFGENGATINVSSQGFLPGEKIFFTLETKDGKSVSQKVGFFPNPMVKEMRADEAKLKLELTSLKPTRYEISLEGIPVNEKLKLTSQSSDEKLENEFHLPQNFGCGITPDVIGKDRGFCDLCITRENGAQFEIRLPWGMELIEYAEGGRFPPVSNFSPIINEI